MSERHWVDNVAEVISGRAHNTMVGLWRDVGTLKNTVKLLGAKLKLMTQNEQKILQAAETLSVAAGQIQTGIQGQSDLIKAQADHIKALEDQIKELEETPVEPAEDLSQEFPELDAAVEAIKNLGETLSPSPAGTPADGSTGTTDSTAGDGGVSTGTIDHGDNPVIDLGPGAADPPAPGTGGSNLPEQPPVEPAPADTPGTVPVSPEPEPTSDPTESPANPASGEEDAQPVADANTGDGGDEFDEE